jgi:hypothetical protein
VIPKPENKRTALGGASVCAKMRKIKENKPKIVEEWINQLL